MVNELEEEHCLQPQCCVRGKRRLEASVNLSSVMKGVCGYGRLRTLDPRTTRSFLNFSKIVMPVVTVDEREAEAC